jgi:hypothetical protein
MIGEGGVVGEAAEGDGEGEGWVVGCVVGWMEDVGTELGCGGDEEADEGGGAADVVGTASELAWAEDVIETTADDESDDVGTGEIGAEEGSIEAGVEDSAGTEEGVGLGSMEDVMAVVDDDRTEDSTTDVEIGWSELTSAEDDGWGDDADAGSDTADEDGKGVTTSDDGTIGVGLVVITAEDAAAELSTAAADEGFRDAVLLDITEPIEAEEGCGVSEDVDVKIEEGSGGEDDSEEELPVDDVPGDMDEAEVGSDNEKDKLWSAPHSFVDIVCG